MANATTSKSVAGIFAAWLAKQGLTAQEAAPALGVAVSTAYGYLAGETVPANTRAAEFAAKVGADPAVFCRIAAADRRRLQQSRKRVARNVPGRVKQGQQVVGSHSNAPHESTVRGRK